MTKRLNFPEITFADFTHNAAYVNFKDSTNLFLQDFVLRQPKILIELVRSYKKNPILDLSSRFIAFLCTTLPTRHS